MSSFPAGPYQATHSGPADLHLSLAADLQLAPTLRFHRTFATLARTVAPDIEIYRFDINENWRAGVRVMRRMRVN